ncbi:hypothetical protein ONZ45_g16418 [Pleurotus djamor]|nr:hypothetical protein ONZ45_g16418 [Pleurotus djamor]
MPQETDKERLIAACWAGAVHTPWYGKREFDYSEDKTDVDPTTQAGGSAWDRGYARQGFVDESLQRHTRRHLKKAADIERWVEGELDKWRAENEAAIRDIWIPMAKKVNEENGGSDWCEDFEELRTASRGRKEKPSARDDIGEPLVLLSATMQLTEMKVRPGSTLFQTGSTLGIAPHTPQRDSKAFDIFSPSSTRTQGGSENNALAGPSRPLARSRNAPTGRRPGYAAKAAKRRVSSVELSDEEASKKEELEARPAKRVKRVPLSNQTTEEYLEAHRPSGATEDSLDTSSSVQSASPRRPALSRSVPSRSLSQ